VVHHIVDPRTGRSTCTGIAGVTVVDGEAWRAEVVAKAVMVLGATVGIALVEGIGAAAFVVGLDGAVTRTTAVETFAA
jgi:thiamine biosynthesis lipoprotein ApbE